MPATLSPVEALNAVSLDQLATQATRATREDIIASLRWHDSHRSETTYTTKARIARRAILANALAATEGGAQ